VIVNQTGAGFHRDTRREARMPRKAEREWAIAEQLGALDDGHLVLEQGTEHVAKSLGDRDQGEGDAEDDQGVLHG
jgi:hypothetical protein